MPDLEDDFQADPKEVARRFSFFPASNAEGFDITSTTETALNGRFAGFRHTVIDRGQRIAMIRLKVGASARGEAALITPSLNAADGIPVYFLPWDSRGAAMELSIPNKDPNLPERQHPRFFFTAVLSGCSIIFKGSARRPTIFHCGTGGESGGGTSTTGDSNAFFLDLIRNVEARNLGRTTATVPVHHPSQVLSTDYMVTRAGGGTAPTLTQNTKDAISQHFRNRMVVEEVTLWGMVFGVRTGRDWKFYLQKNGTIYYKPFEAVLRDIQTTETRRFGLIKYRVNKTRQVSRFEVGTTTRVVNRPIELTRVFPGVGNAKVTNSWRSLV